MGVALVYPIFPSGGLSSAEPASLFRPGKSFEPSIRVCAFQVMKLFNPRLRRIPAGFTLIELLTVIAIIGILAAILIPTVSSVREKAKTIDCTQRIRQWGMALTLYANDYKGRYIIHEDNNPWCQISASGLRAYLPYLGNGQSVSYDQWMGCPSQQGQDELKAAGGNTPQYFGYAIAKPHINGKTIDNITKVGTKNQLLVPLSRAAQPSRTILVLERTYAKDGPAMDTGDHVTVDKDKPVASALAAFTRHKSRFNVVFMDGHAKPMKLDDFMTGSGRGATFNNEFLRLY